MSLPRREFLSLLATAPALAMTSSHAADSPPDMPHVTWSRQAVIYQVNVRQYSAEGTLASAMAELPRLKAMGVDILWLMPIQPIGQLHRKGTLGSYYSIRDYTAVNPEFGTLDDARAFVRAAHAQGMKVILDWAANHTAFDHPWTREHKDWYRLDAHGQIFPVTFNAGTPREEHWSDVTQLDYEAPALRDAMIAAMRFWVTEVDLDGFRCDVAGEVPTPFWERARRELDAVKPMFMLAEADKIELHRAAFDMTYSWDLAQLFERIGQGKAGAPELRQWLAKEPHGYPLSAYRMRFTSNHDFNSWNGTDAELYRDAYLPLAVLTFTLRHAAGLRRRGGAPGETAGVLREGSNRLEDARAAAVLQDARGAQACASGARGRPVRRGGHGTGRRQRQAVRVRAPQGRGPRRGRRQRHRRRAGVPAGRRAARARTARMADRGRMSARPAAPKGARTAARWAEVAL